MGEFLAVYMVDAVEVGDRFTMWPLHLTLLPWFEAPSVKDVAHQFEGATRGIQPFEVTVGARGYLGRFRDVPVRLVHNTVQLQDLHEKLLLTALDRSWRLQGRYTGKYFKPHITQKAGRDAAEGTLLIDSVYIAERQPQGYREIVGKVELE